MKEFSDAKLEAILKERAASSGFNGWLDIEVIAAGNGRVETRVKVRTEMQQHHGYVHGGVIGAFADTNCAWAGASVKGDVVTSTYTLQLLAPAREEYLRAEAEVLKAGKRNASVEAKIYSENENGDSRLVATALALITAV